MAKQYDKILKENIEEIFLPLAEKYLGLKILKTEILPEKVQVTQEREVDFNKIVYTDSGEKFILHLEFQTSDDVNMIYRIAQYKAMKMYKFHLPVKSVVIYFGMEKPKMRTQLREQEVIEGFELLNLHALDAERILESDVPEEVILAILGKYPELMAGLLIKRVIVRLKELCGEEARFNKYLKQLIVLSRLRKLELETKKTIEEMPITYDITKDGLYLEGKKDGMQKGILKGAEQERKKRNIEIAETLLKKGMSAVEVSEISTLSVEEVIKIQERHGLDDK
jgi:predicted transposase YdaD